MPEKEDVVQNHGRSWVNEILGEHVVNVEMENPLASINS